MYLIVEDMRAGYANICDTVLQDGDEVEVRGQLTREMRAVTIELREPWNALPIGTNRGLAPAIGIAEALQLMGGFSDPALMCRIAPTFSSFLNGGAFNGAYGPRLRQQLPLAYDLLCNDPTTRQSVVTIWNPLFDQQTDFGGGLRDIPCTVSLQFFIRNDRLELHTHMRSNDVWWGLAYDAFQYTRLQLLVAEMYGCDVGSYFHHVGSMHAYERDWEKIEDLNHYPKALSDLQVAQLSSSGVAGSSLGQVRRNCEDIVYLDDEDYERNHGTTKETTVEWYRSTLQPYRLA